jgi:hypothetical protein
MPPLPEAIILVLAPFAQLFSHRVWCHAQLSLPGAMLAPGKRIVTVVLQVMGLAMERRFMNYQRVLTRSIWSTHHAGQILIEELVALLVPAGPPLS